MDPQQIYRKKIKTMSSFFPEIPPYYENQNETLDLLRQQDRVFDLSDPGTGKTRPALGAFIERRAAGGKKCLVLAPKSILQPAWGDDIDKFFPGTSYMVAYASNRKKAFLDFDVDIYITNHDAVTWLMGTHKVTNEAGETRNVRNIPLSYWNDFDTIIVDEFTAYKNQNSLRSKAAYKLARLMDFRELMSGTPNPNSITELFHPTKILDDGEHLGTSFWKFRSAVQEPEQVGPEVHHLEWKDKEDAEFTVYSLIDEFSIRHILEECQDIPDNKVTEYYIDLPPGLRKHYDSMVDIAATLLEDGKLLTAVHASAVHQKLMQIASGAVYTALTGAGETPHTVIDDGRAELVMDLACEREQCLIAFNWRHQRAGLERAAKARKRRYAIIDGSVSDKKRREAVDMFQAGELDDILAHPQSAGHGLTLTRGTTTIWASPTYNAELYKQFNHRIYRAGQKYKTETIHIIARNTTDEKVYGKLSNKLTSMQLLLDLIKT